MGFLSDKLSQLDFSELLQVFYTQGWFQFVFPFLLMYAIVFTILNQTNLFKRKAIRVMIALIFSLFAIAFPVTGSGEFCATNSMGTSCGNTLGHLMMSLFPGVGMIAIIILCLYIVAGLLGVDLMNFLGENNPLLRWILGALALLVLIYFLGSGLNWWNTSGSSGSWSIWELFKDPLLYVLILFGLFMWWISRDDGDEGHDAGHGGGHGGGHH